MSLPAARASHAATRQGHSCPHTVARMLAACCPGSNRRCPPPLNQGPAWDACTHVQAPAPRPSLTSRGRWSSRRALCRGAPPPFFAPYAAAGSARPGAPKNCGGRTAGGERPTPRHQPSPLPRLRRQCHPHPPPPSSLRRQTRPQPSALPMPRRQSVSLCTGCPPATEVLHSQLPPASQLPPPPLRPAPLATPADNPLS